MTKRKDPDMELGVIKEDFSRLYYKILYFINRRDTTHDVREASLNEMESWMNDIGALLDDYRFMIISRNF